MPVLQSRETEAQRKVLYPLSHSAYAAEAPRPGSFPSPSRSVLTSAPTSPTPEYGLSVWPMKWESSLPLQWPLCGAAWRPVGHTGPVSDPLLQNPQQRAFGAVKVKISSNWGNPRFTCLYRVRVHGSVAPPLKTLT